MQLASCNSRFEQCYCDISADTSEMGGDAAVVETWGGISRSGT